MYPQGVCRIRKPAYAGNGCAIFLVFQTEEVGQKDGCGSQTQLRGVALGAPGQCPLPRRYREIIARFRPECSHGRQHSLLPPAGRK